MSAIIAIIHRQTNKKNYVYIIPIDNNLYVLTVFGWWECVITLAFLSPSVYKIFPSVYKIFPSVYKIFPVYIKSSQHMWIILLSWEDFIYTWELKKDSF